MKKISFAIFIVLTTIFIGSCEKDDICVNANTPLLVITFYDSNDTEVSKAVPSLRVGGIDNEFTVNTIADRTSLDSIGLPLKTNDVTTSFAFIKDSEDNDEDLEIGNVDVITFNYEVIEEFNSRACGFIANYGMLTATLQSDSDEWIQDIVITDTLVKNQAATHVKIYH
ncbi:MAG: hypothetical protein COA50_12825 [Flavobacteriaceae bacterium]|nr:MAG: hypothetical protein COA50_12825 [Flavobacteriaceae bacterium]